MIVQGCPTSLFRASQPYLPKLRDKVVLEAADGE